MDDKLKEAERFLPGRDFDYQKGTYRCLYCTIISTRKLIIKTLTRTLVLQESDLDSLYVRPLEEVVSNNQAKSKAQELTVKMIAVKERHPHYKNMGKPWSIDDDSLVQAKNDGIIKDTYYSLAGQLGRPMHCISQRAYILKVQAKEKAEREETFVKEMEAKRKIIQKRFVATEIEPDIRLN